MSYEKADGESERKFIYHYCTNKRQNLDITLLLYQRDSQRRDAGIAVQLLIIIIIKKMKDLQFNSTQ